MDVDSDMPAHTSSAHHARSPRAHSGAHAYDDYPTLVIRNVHLPFDSDSPTLADPLYNVYCVGGRVDRIELATANGSGSVSGSSGRNSPARHPEYSSSPSPRGNGAGAGPRDHRQGSSSSSHGELDAQGRGILLPASVRSSMPVPPFLALTPSPRRLFSFFLANPQARARTHPPRQVLLARPVR